MLLGLKGNVDMPLASRLGTASHRGEMASLEKARPLLLANLALVEVQTVVVGALAAVIAVLLGVVLHHEFDLCESPTILASPRCHPPQHAALPRRLPPGTTPCFCSPPQS